MPMMVTVLRSAAVAGGTTVTHSTPFFGTVEIGLERSIGSWRIGASIGTFFIPAPGPASAHGEVAIGDRGLTTNAIAGERTYGPFVVLMPQLSVSYSP